MRTASTTEATAGQDGCWRFNVPFGHPLRGRHFSTVQCACRSFPAVCHVFQYRFELSTLKSRISDGIPMSFKLTLFPPFSTRLREHVESCAAFMISIAFSVRIFKKRPDASGTMTYSPLSVFPFGSRFQPRQGYAFISSLCL